MPTEQCTHPWSVCDEKGPYCQACGLAWWQVEKENEMKQTVPANEHEAQRGLNDTFPGDPYPVESVLQDMRQRSVQAIGAGLSRRDWHATEVAYNALRDQMDVLISRLSSAR